MDNSQGNRSEQSPALEIKQCTWSVRSNSLLTTAVDVTNGAVNSVPAGFGKRKTYRFVARRECLPRVLVALDSPQVLAHLPDLVANVELVVKLVRPSRELDVDVQTQKRRDQVFCRRRVSA